MDASDAKRLSWVAAAGLVAAAPVLVSTARALDDALRRRGITVATPDATMAPLLGSWYATGSQTLPNNVLIGDRRPPPGDARVIARISPTRVFGPPAVDPQGAEPPFAVTLLRRGSGR